ncbi:ExbD/TolR family protein [Novosphingobium sp. Rr 2-17]|uniref:ExbD/TolR family protein n=1 Tax=Novosphingobium sp. Rr 2-17 TaxID=555793 RepID=UPI0012F68BE7|nr:hypothetical protein [Novosphingobium sp. Rr 2-17]
MFGAAILLSGCHRERTYADGCGAMPSNWITPRQGRGVLSVLSIIDVSGDGTIKWNRAKISETQFRDGLKPLARMNPLPVTQIKFATDVPCETVVRLRKAISTNLDCQYGLCAEGNGRWWIIGDVGPPFIAFDPHPELPQDSE